MEMATECKRDERLHICACVVSTHANPRAYTPFVFSYSLKLFQHESCQVHSEAFLISSLLKLVP